MSVNLHKKKEFAIKNLESRAHQKHPNILHNQPGLSGVQMEVQIRPIPHPKIGFKTSSKVFCGGGGQKAF